MTVAVRCARRVQGSPDSSPGVWEGSSELKQSNRDAAGGGGGSGAGSRPLTLAAATEFLHRTAFTDGPTGRVGVELEWLVVPLGTGTPGSADDLLLGPAGLPGGSRLTNEPGGQLELSSLPFPDMATACAAVASDVAVLRAALAERALGLLGMGLHPDGARPLVHPTDRYRAMDAYFAANGPAGRTMMTATASVQVNLDAGPAGQHDDRWAVAHRLGPVLAAAFANSPCSGGRPTGQRSTRLVTWEGIDASRTAPAWQPGQDCGSWARYALDARVMFVPTVDGRLEAVARPLTFAGWIAGGHPDRRPTLCDLEYHLTTLFPPVRPRGWLELRFLDALPPAWWPVAVAVTTALLDDEEARAEAAAAAAPVTDRWSQAARQGLGHPPLALAARRCFALALASLDAGGHDRDVVDAVAAYADRFVARGRCPADDRLDRWQATGSWLLAEDDLDQRRCTTAGVPPT